jgi:oligoendopeptidase F
MTQQPHRKAVPLEQTWDLDSLYPSVTDWEAELGALEILVAEYQEACPRLGVAADGFLAMLRLIDQIRQMLARLTYYADNRQAEDAADPQRQALRERSGAASALVSTALASFKPAVLALPDGTVERWLREQPALAPYRLSLAEIRAQKAHQLGVEAEAVIGALSELTQAPFTIWQNTVSADLTMDPVNDHAGHETPMSYAALSRFYQSPHRTVRRAAFDSLNAGYARHKHTIAATLATAIKRDVLLARLRRYPSAVAAALAPVGLPEAALRNLVDTAEAGSAHLRRYMTFRSRELGLNQQAPYDMGISLDNDATSFIPFTDGFALVREATAVLGPEYRALLDRAHRERWVDWADNLGKTAIPFSRDCYGYHPAVNLPWHGTLADVMLLAHELGHALHTAFSQRAQPYVLSAYTGLLAETASTTNELLVANHLRTVSAERRVRRLALIKTIDSFITNFFYGSMATALQLALHDMAERGEALTYESITAVSTAIYQRFYGDTLAVTAAGIGSQWLRVSQHYFGFYSYQYVTGIAAAAAVSVEILSGEASALHRYLTFLKAGSSAPPLDVLRLAGVDLLSRLPGERAVAAFSDLVTALEHS